MKDKEPLCISDKCITIAMEDKSHVYPKNGIVNDQITNQHHKRHTSFATFERARYSPTHTGIVVSVGRHPKKKKTY